MKKIILIISILLKVSFVHAQLSGVYQIGASQVFPFNTIKNAVDNINTAGVSAPVTFLLNDALYEESGINFVTVPGTSTTNTITLKPSNGVDVIIQGDGEFVIGIDRTSHLTFNGLSPDKTGSLTITSTETNINSSVIKSTTPINTSGNMFDIHISNCILNAAPPFFSEDWNIKSYGIYFNSYVGSMDSIAITNNIFTDSDKSIKIIQHGSYEKIDIINNDFISSGGIEIIDDGGFHGKLIRIQGNSFINTNLSIMSSRLSCISIDGSLELFITNNIFDGINYNFSSFNMDCTLFQFHLVKNTLIYNNIVKNINYNAFYSPIPGINLATFIRIFVFNNNENIKFYHNSVYIPIGNENGFLTGADSHIRGIFLDENQYFECKNNIFTLLQGNKPGAIVNSSAVIYAFASSEDISTLQSDNNSYFVDNHTNNYFYSILSSFAYNDFLNWQTTYPLLDQNSYWEMPKVISKEDLHLSQDCNRGIPIAEVPLDFEKRVRSTIKPDIGAYELIKTSSIISNGNCQLSTIDFSILNTANIQSLMWDFGDNQTSTELEPEHTYTNAGTYRVTLTVTYNDNSIGATEKNIEIYAKPIKPIIEHE